MRIVLDTNVVISAFLSPSGPPAQIVDAWQRREFMVIVSQAVIAEYQRALEYDHIRKRHRMTNEQLDELISGFHERGTLVALDETINIVRDPNDNHLIECAVAESATYNVSGDSHLLEVGEHRGIYIVTPRAFLAVMSL